MVAYKLGIFSFKSVIDEERPNYTIRLIKQPDILPKKPVLGKKQDEPDKGESGNLKKIRQNEVEKIDLASNSSETVDAVPEIELNRLPEDNDDSKIKDQIKQYAKKNFTLPEIVKIDGDKLPENRKKFNRVIIPKLQREIGVNEFSFDPEAYLSDSSSKLPQIADGGKEAVPGVNPNKNNEYLPDSSSTSLFPSDKVKPMDLMIDVELYKYPLNDGSGFFRIDLKPNQRASALRTFRKDVIFLLDISGSIGQTRLREMKSGIFVTLETLHPEDRFNIIAFSSVNQPLFKEPMHPNKETMQAAEVFLFKLRHRGSTNIFSALNLYIGDKYRTGSRPLIVFLISDGNVNSGRIVDSSELINTVSNRNNDGAHIYTFACGPEKNSFLMDLLAYRNRGESKYIKEISNSRVPLAKFIYNVSDVKVADLNYQTSSDLSEKIFPKRLENLYKGKTLSLYGYYPHEIKNIGIRITGKDSSGVRREIVFSKKIANAESATDNLPKKWAEQYIYHLYSLLTVKYNTNMADKILRTAKRFRVDIPYLNEHVQPRKRKYLK